MKSVLVLGVGNRLLMDDGIGLYVVEELNRKNKNSNISYVVGETDIYFCLDQIEEISAIIIIDAARLGNKPGFISIIPFQQALSNPFESISDHESHLLNEIRLKGKSIEGIFIGIEPYEIDYCVGLSPVIRTQFYSITGEIKKIIQAYEQHRSQK